MSSTLLTVYVQAETNHVSSGKLESITIKNEKGQLNQEMEYVLELSVVYVYWLTQFINRQDLIKYDMTDVVLSRHNNFY
jgi:hypothetical protein